MNNRVLIVAPSHESKNYCSNEYYTNLYKIAEFSNADILIADNTAENKNKHLYDAVGVNTLWLSTKKIPMHAITDSQNALREVFLNNENGYTHWMFIESDLIPPATIIAELLAHQKGIVGCPYFIFKGQGRKPMLQWMSRASETFGVNYQYNIDEGFNLTDGHLKQVHALGFGCVLIERDIIEMFPFRSSDQRTNDTKHYGKTQGIAHSDSYFYNDLAREQIPVWCDTSITITHLNHPTKR